VQPFVNAQLGAGDGNISFRVKGVAASNLRTPFYDKTNGTTLSPQLIVTH
jgi:hypothetical protein